jgi:hypothetical protein
LFLGIRDESGEAIIGTKDGVVKAKDFRRRPGQERWKKERVDKLSGVPWCPIPSEPGQIDLKVRIRLPDAASQIVQGAQGSVRDNIARIMKIRQEDVLNYGCTQGWLGCRAISRGVTAQSHKEECRTRIIEAIVADGRRWSGEAGRRKEQV